LLLHLSGPDSFPPHMLEFKPAWSRQWGSSSSSPPGCRPLTYCLIPVLILFVSFQPDGKLSSADLSDSGVLLVWQVLDLHTSNIHEVGGATTSVRTPAPRKIPVTVLPVSDHMMQMAAEAYTQALPPSSSSIALRRAWARQPRKCSPPQAPITCKG
jgi:hypothetical protein